MNMIMIMIMIIASRDVVSVIAVHGVSIKKPHTRED